MFSANRDADKILSAKIRFDKGTLSLFNGLDKGGLYLQTGMGFTPCYVIRKTIRKRKIVSFYPTAANDLKLN